MRQTSVVHESLHLVVDVNVVDDLTCLEIILNGDDLLSLRRGTGAAHEVEDLAFLIAVRVADLYLEHEAVDLRLGQGVGALRSIGSGWQHEERLKAAGRLADGDLPFLHGFEQGAHAGRGAIDLVRQNEVSEYRALTRAEVAGLFVWVPTTSAGSMSGVNCSRAKSASMHWASDLIESVLVKLAPSSSMTVGEQAYDWSLDEHSLADHDLAHLPRSG